jgi:hypothetical protein
MIQELQKLSGEEKQLLYDALPLVALLIGGADGEIDVNEKEWSKKITHIRTYTHRNSFREFFEELDKNFGEKLESFIDEFPSEVKPRIEAISERLRGLNPILRKINPLFARDFVDELKSFAHHIARASGGFFRVGSISKEESELLELPMIDPV